MFSSDPTKIGEVSRSYSSDEMYPIILALSRDSCWLFLAKCGPYTISNPRKLVLQNKGLFAVDSY